jgi:hypothetical protein
MPCHQTARASEHTIAVNASNNKAPGSITLYLPVRSIGVNFQNIYWWRPPLLCPLDLFSAGASLIILIKLEAASIALCEISSIHRVRSFAFALILLSHHTHKKLAAIDLSFSCNFRM